MATYIVKEKNELHIYREDQKEAFLADYGPISAKATPSKSVDLPE